MIQFLRRFFLTVYIFTFLYNFWGIAIYHLLRLYYK